MVQSILEEIDRRIHETIRVDELAGAAGYSVYHFCRIFMALTGTPIMAYASRRKLEHALGDLSQGRKVIDVAMDYGFETHAGFTKAFKRTFGFPPSLCPVRITARTPQPPALPSARTMQGGSEMNPYITVMTPFTAAGRTARMTLPNVRRHADIPAFCFSPAYEKDTENLLTDTSKLFAKSDAIKHCEVSMCFDAQDGAFTYLLGRGVFHPDDLKNIPPDMVRVEIYGLYAVFSTTPMPFEQHDACAQAIQSLWNDILLQWLPHSEFEYDETRRDFEFYDHRDHGHFFENKRQMDICVPIRQRAAAKRKSQERGKRLWAEEMKRREALMSAP